MTLFNRQANDDVEHFLPLEGLYQMQCTAKSSIRSGKITAISAESDSLLGSMTLFNYQANDHVEYLPLEGLYQHQCSAKSSIREWQTRQVQNPDLLCSVTLFNYQANDVVEHLYQQQCATESSTRKWQDFL